MAAQVVYTSAANGSSLDGSLFKDKVFWIAQRTPSRSRYVALVESNGGTVAPLENHADYLICDHLRKDNPAGAISYTFIEHSIKTGEVVDPDAHACAPARGVPRPVGALQATKSGRVAFSTEDDQILYKWVKEAQAKGEKELGNRIFQQLEQVNTRHTWQSWRDRYVKKLRDNPPSSWEELVVDKSRQIPSTEQQSSTAHAVTHDRDSQKSSQIRNDTARNSARRPPTPESLRIRRDQKEQLALKSQQTVLLPYLAISFLELLDNFEAISDMPHEEFVACWEAYAASDHGKPHASADWQDFFQIAVSKFHEKYMTSPAVKERIVDEMINWVAANPGATIESWQKYWKISKKRILDMRDASTPKMESHTFRRPASHSPDERVSSPRQRSTQESSLRSRKRAVEVAVNDEDLPPDSPKPAKKRKIAQSGPGAARAAARNEDEMAPGSIDQTDKSVLNQKDLEQAARGALSLKEGVQSDPVQVQKSDEPSVVSDGTSRKHTASSIQGELASPQLIAESSIRTQPSPVKTPGPAKHGTEAHNGSNHTEDETPRASRIKDLTTNSAVASPQGSYRLLKAAGTLSQVLDTQAMFNVDSQDLELGMVEPDGGFEVDEPDEHDITTDNWAVGLDDIDSESHLLHPHVAQANMYENHTNIHDSLTSDGMELSADSVTVARTDGAEQSDGLARQTSQHRLREECPSTEEISTSLQDGIPTDSFAPPDESQSDFKNASQQHAELAELNLMALSDDARATSIELGGEEQEIETVVPVRHQPTIDISSDRDSQSSDSEDSSDESDDQSETHQITPRQRPLSYTHPRSDPATNIQPEPQPRRRTLPWMAQSKAKAVEPTPEKVPTNLNDLIRVLQAEGIKLEQHIKPALKATCASLELTAKVARTLRTYNKMPENVPGIWTDADDRELKVRGTKSGRILAKHGEERCEIREEWLERLAGKTG